MPITDQSAIIQQSKQMPNTKNTMIVMTASALEEQQEAILPSDL
jgi:CheY-like chemotaxis protein